MAPAITPEEEAADCAMSRVLALPEMWALFVEHGGDLVEAWRLMRVCRAARVGAKEWLRTLSGLVVCGGSAGGAGGVVSDVWRLDLATLRWEPMLAFLSARAGHACCAVRGTLVVLGGLGFSTSSVEMLSEETGEFVNLPPSSCGAISGSVAVAVEESDSAAGQVLLIGGHVSGSGAQSAMYLVDLATGACAPQPTQLNNARYYHAADRLPDARGRIVCAGGYPTWTSAEVYGPSVQGALDAAWTWRDLPPMSVGRFGCRGCVMSDGRFAVLGGSTSSCEALVISEGAQWEPLHDSWAHFACGAMAGCIIVAGGSHLKSAEVYNEVLHR
jgi:hypothetical protein